MSVMKFRKKPVVIEAVQWKGNNWDELEKFSPYDLMYDFPASKKSITVKTLEGHHTCSLNDWLIKGIKGEFYPCKPDIFEATYEPV